MNENETQAETKELHPLDGWAIVTNYLRQFIGKPIATKQEGWFRLQPAYEWNTNLQSHPTGQITYQRMAIPLGMQASAREIVVQVTSFFWLRQLDPNDTATIQQILEQAEAIRTSARPATHAAVQEGPRIVMPDGAFPPRIRR